MMNRLDALAVRESNGKSYFTKIGVAFPNKDGKGFAVLLDAIPASTDGQFKIMLREPLDKEGGARNMAPPARPQPSRDLDDEIPF